jgi:hypothetical protein
MGVAFNEIVLPSGWQIVIGKDILLSRQLVSGVRFQVSVPIVKKFLFGVT